MVSKIINQNIVVLWSIVYLHVKYPFYYVLNMFLLSSKYIKNMKIIGTSVCDGDSGGGLVFENKGFWYLKGIVSLSLSTKEVGGTRTCDSTTYSLFTRVFNHMPWIQKVLDKLEHNTFSSCNLR